MSLAKLTSQSTQTLSLLLERQRLNNLSPSSSNLHLPQIARNLALLRSGILNLDATAKSDSEKEGARLLRSQYERMRMMLPEDVQADLGIESLKILVREEDAPQASSSSPQPQPVAPKDEPVYTPYTDDPEAQQEPSALLLEQRELMDEQDQHLEQLSHSIGRQRDLSLQINSELDVHTGLLEELDTELDTTGSRLSSARRRLDKVARGIRGNGSTVTIAGLIIVLLILIVIFKT